MEPIEIGNALKIGRATHEGMSGKHNEDYYGLFAWKMQDGRPLYVAVVADGVGGQNAGEVASQEAVKRVGEYFTALAQVNSVLPHLERAILAAHEAVFQYTQDHPETQGMATTMVLVAILGNRLYTSTVGDSRLYFLREGRLRQISVDHTWAQEAIEAGLLTPEQARTHPNRNVIKRYLGSPSEVQVDQRLMWEEGQEMRIARGNQGMVLEPGDTILLSSDGLTDMIDDAAVLRSLHRHYHNLQEAADELIEKANQGGGKDNITALILQIPGGGRLSAAAPLPASVAPTAAPPPTLARTPVPVLPPPPADGGPAPRTGLALPLLVGGAGIFGIILILAIGGLLWAAGNGNDNDSPTNTPTVAVVLTQGAGTTDGGESQPTQTGESPATAILIISTEDGTAHATTTPEAAGTSATSPALIPTLRPTTTPTRIPPTPTRTPTPLPPATATATPDDSGGGGNNPPPPATEPQTQPPTPTPED